MAMPQCCYLAKGAKRPSHTTNTIKFDRIPFDPCNSIKRFDLSPFDQKNSTYLQPPNQIVQFVCFLNRFGVRMLANVQQRLKSKSIGLLKEYLQSSVGKCLKYDRKKLKMLKKFVDFWQYQ